MGWALPGAACRLIDARRSVTESNGIKVQSRRIATHFGSAFRPSLSTFTNVAFARHMAIFDWKHMLSVYQCSLLPTEKFSK